MQNRHDSSVSVPTPLVIPIHNVRDRRIPSLSSSVHPCRLPFWPTDRAVCTVHDGEGVAGQVDEFLDHLYFP